jgi:hypothetical protein
LHVVEPEQSTVHPPAGHATVQTLFPWHATLPPLPTDKLHVLVPSHVTFPLSPVDSVHVLPPPHVDVQFDPQLPVHADCPAHDVVHPVPQLTVQLFFESQLYVTPLGAPASAPASPPPPSEQVPPELHVHVVPLHEHAPVQAICADDGDAPVHAAKTKAAKASGAILRSMR